MNHYPHHIGDYLKDTAHLSLLEHGCYRRMLDVYYTREGPLPGELPAVCRLVGASTRDEKKAVEAVLSEFFFKAEDGWRQGRADAEIARYQESADEQGEKARHETERMRRHRERRKELFAALRERGIVPKWDMPMLELQRLADANRNEPETRTGNDLQREQERTGNADATANQNQNQNQNQEKKQRTPVATTPPPAETTRAAGPDGPEIQGQVPSAAVAIAVELRRRGVKVNGAHPTVQAWVTDGFTLPAVVEALEVARMRKPDEEFGVNYLDPILRQPPKKAEPAWWSSDKRIEAKGREFALSARPGESMEQFKSRIQDEMAKKKVAA